MISPGRKPYTSPNLLVRGFTIVELLIVIVIIAILAAITVVSYGFIQQQSEDAAAKAVLIQVSKALGVHYSGVGNETYPASLSVASINESPKYAYNYSSLATNVGPSKAYCLTIQNGRGNNYFITSDALIPIRGTCVGLAGWWKLNGTAVDSSGYGRFGTISGATPSAGQDGKQNTAYAFTASSQEHINIVSTDLLDIHNSGEVSYSAWFYGQPTSSTLMRGASTGGTVVTASQNCQFEPAFRTGDVRLSGCSSLGSVSSYSPLPNEWNNLVATFSETSDWAIVYLNGLEVGRRSIAAIKAAVGVKASMIFNANSALDFLVIGASYTDDAASLYSGSGTSVDDVRVYSRPLSSPEVKEIFSAGAQ